MANISVCPSAHSVRTDGPDVLPCAAGLALDSYFPLNLANPTINYLTKQGAPLPAEPQKPPGAGRRRHEGSTGAGARRKGQCLREMHGASTGPAPVP